jgi:hypothetical protein
VDEINKIKEAMRMIESQTKGNESEYCVKFVERTNQDNWIQVQNSGGCGSWVGKLVQKGPQSLSLKSYCLASTPDIAHEFIHALGFAHEHTRPDRDDWVEVLNKSINPGIYNATSYNI